MSRVDLLNPDNTNPPALARGQTGRVMNQRRVHYRRGVKICKGGITSSLPTMTTNNSRDRVASDYSHYGEGFGNTTRTTTGYGEHTHRTPPPGPEAVDTSEAFLIAAAVSGFPESVSGCLFSNPLHRSIADTLRTMRASGDPIDFATVLTRLEPTEAAALQVIIAEPANLSAMDGDGAVIAYHQTQLKTAAHHRQLSAKQRELNKAVETGDLSRIAPLAAELAALAVNVQGDTLAKLDARRIKLHPAPTKPTPVLRLLGQDIATPGNLMTIQSQAKTGKSAVVGGMVAALVVGDSFADSPWDAPDLLGFTAPSNAHGHAVLTFDTEQSSFDAWRLIRRICDRAGIDELPDWLRPYRMNDVSTAERRGLFAAELERASAECGGIIAAFVDGGADLCIDPNDAGEAFALIDEWRTLAVKFNTVIVVIIHENPGSADTGGKPRGHLGSQLTRKAETNLRLVGSGDTTEIFTAPSRSCFIAKGEGQLIRYDADAGMHVSVHRETVEGKADLRRAELADPLDEIFDGVVGGMKWAEFNAAIGKVMGLKGGSVGRMLKEFLALGMVKKDASTCRYCRVTTNYQTTTK